MLLRIWSLIFLIHLPALSSSEKSRTRTVKCADLLVGQYRCQNPIIDDLTQEPQGCERVHFVVDGDEDFLDTAPITCHAAPRIVCDGGVYNDTLELFVFEKRTSCRWTNGKHYRTTLFLSLFLGKRKDQIRIHRHAESLLLIRYFWY